MGERFGRAKKRRGVRKPEGRRGAPKIYAHIGPSQPQYGPAHLWTFDSISILSPIVSSNPVLPPCQYSILVPHNAGYTYYK